MGGPVAGVSDPIRRRPENMEAMDMQPSSPGGEIEDFMQPVAKLADELRSEEPMARVEAMKRLSTIALALGQERTRTELIPFLQSTAMVGWV